MPKVSEHYTKTFFADLRSGVYRSAGVIVPMILQKVQVRSVVDVGCGDGSWLAVFRKFGVPEILGIDGEYIEAEVLQIPKKCYLACDLTNPVRIDRTFDLAVSLEVAEHLPSECARIFVESLTLLAPLVLFSAAIPFQGGTHHVNEQWPEKWAELFQKHGYLPVDFIRKRVWQNEDVEWWYAQNTLLFATADALSTNPGLKAEFEKTVPTQLSLVHPRRYLEAMTHREPPRGGVTSAWQSLLVRLKKSFGNGIKSATQEPTAPSSGSDSVKS